MKLLLILFLVSAAHSEKNKKGLIFYKYTTGEDSAKVRYDGGKVIQVIRFYKNGMKEAELNWQGQPPKNNKEGYDKYYYPNGKVREIALFKNNKRIKFSRFREDGKLIEKGVMHEEVWKIQEFDLPPIKEKYRIQVGLNSVNQ